jgi:ornithine decarboxylase
LTNDGVGQALRDKINKIDCDVEHLEDQDTFFVADLGEVYRQFMRWKASLNRIKPHYGESSFLNVYEIYLSH